MSDSQGRFGFVWGNVWVTRATHIEGRGRVVRIAATDQEHDVQVYVSEGGRSIRVFNGGKEMEVPHE